jgi:plasmid rolling circle replication initiator protein Rep
MLRTVVSNGMEPFETDNEILVQPVALRQLSPKDEKWDARRSESDRIKELYQGTDYDALAGRIEVCSKRLGLAMMVDPETGVIKLNLHSAQFCRVRHCAVCQWRRTLKNYSKAFKIFPQVIADYPKHQYILLTLTLVNPSMKELRDTLKEMNLAWNRLTQRKDFPADGWTRSTEVTRAEDDRPHPHFHCLLMVPPSYFSGSKYLSQEAWTNLWRDVMKLNYNPIVDVRKVKPKNGTVDIERAIVETMKYTVKPSDIIGESDDNINEKDREWLVNLTTALHNTRAFASGGIIKTYLKKHEEERKRQNEERKRQGKVPLDDYVHINEEVESLIEENQLGLVFADWHKNINQYIITDEED